MKISVVKNILEANDRIAQENRAIFDESNLMVINLMSSPGAGKTSLLEKTIDALGNVTQYFYDENSNLIAIIDPEGNRKEFSHNEYGWVTEEKFYDRDGHLLQRITYTYDEVGNQTSRTIYRNGEPITTSYEYDALGRITKVTDPYGNYTQTLYNEIGKAWKVRDKNGNFVDYRTMIVWEYDYLNNKVF